MALWTKKNKEAASALLIWGANNPNEAVALLNLDCSAPNQFKKKITDALHNPSGPKDGFSIWCQKYPKAAKKLKHHTRALCKVGILAKNIIEIAPVY